MRVEGRTKTVQAGWGLAAQCSGKPAFWLAGLMVLAAVTYALDYAEAVKSTQALALTGAAMVGQGVALWEGRRKKDECRRGSSGIVLSLIILLAGAAVWQAETGRLFQYRGQARWSGPWDNPNTFGVLMGVGFVLAVGSLKSKVQSLKSNGQGPQAEVQSPMSNVQSLRSAEHPTSNAGAPPSTRNSHPINRVFCLLQGAFFLAAAVVMGVGLVKSYSRGAWVATALGLLWLGINREIRQRREHPTSNGAAQPSTLNPQPFNRALCLAVLVLSVSVLAFWSLRSVEWRPVRRAASVGNINDFSWRNRVAAWEGALQMMADKPWLGFGWNQPERVYDSFYRPGRLTEDGAMQMNDYLMLGTTLGVPALLCFLMYVGLCLTRPMDHRPRTTDHGPPSNDHGPRTPEH